MSPYKDPKAARAHMKAYHAAHKEERKAKREKSNALARARHAANPERINARKRACYAIQPEAYRLHCKTWNDAHREQHNDYNTQRRKDHPDIIKTLTKNRRDANPEPFRDKCSKWQHSHPEMQRERSARHKALKLGATVGRVNYVTIVEHSDMVCGVCGEAVSDETLSFDHIVPLARGGPHSQDNLQVAHRVCNSRKGARLMSELQPSG